MDPTDIQRLRTLRGWTQTEAAAKTGVTANTWARWERGEVTPHPLRIPRLQRELRRAERLSASRLRKTAPLGRAAELLRRVGA